MMRLHASSIAIVAALLLVLPSSMVVAQDESPAPDQLAAPADNDLASVFPVEVGGVPWDDLVVKVGQQIRDDQDEEQSARTEALLESLGATVDDMTTVSASLAGEDTTGSIYLAAIKVSGVDADALLEGILPSITGSLEQPRQEDSQVAGKDVIVLRDDSLPDSQPVYLYASGDIVWLILAVEPLLTQVLEQLP